MNGGSFEAEIGATIVAETEDVSSDEVGTYQFVPDAHACDICQSMEGVYEDAPHVPVHPHCGCRIVRLAADDADCEYEVRNVLLDAEYYTERESYVPFALEQPLDADTDVTQTL